MAKYSLAALVLSDFDTFLGQRGSDLSTDFETLSWMLNINIRKSVPYVFSEKLK